MAEVGRLERVPLRDIWKHEALQFTPWLAANLSALGNALNLRLRLEATEHTVGSFSLDILAEDMGTGDLVIVENQIEKTDHDHLGKVLTYLTNLNAKTAIWITSDARPEHIKAVAWLNEASPEDISFYLVRVEAYRIGDSLPAPVFSRIVEPTADSKAVGQKKEELAERHVDRRQFWTELLTKAKSATSLHANISPGFDNWVSAKVPLPGVNFAYVILMSDARIEMYIDRGANYTSWNKDLFDRLHSERQEIESIFGDELNWDRLDDGRACRISQLLGMGGLRARGSWVEIQDAMIDRMTRLYDAIFPRAQSIIAQMVTPPDV